MISGGPRSAISASSGSTAPPTRPIRLAVAARLRRRGSASRRPGTSPGSSPAHTAMSTGTWRARRPCDLSRRQRSCSDHRNDVVGIVDPSMTTTSAKERNYHWKHIYRLLSTYCRTKDLYYVS